MARGFEVGKELRVVELRQLINCLELHDEMASDKKIHPPFAHSGPLVRDLDNGLPDE